MLWLVIGSKGQLGKQLCRELSLNAIDFIEWHRGTGDISNKNFVNSFINRTLPSVIVNCAAWTDVDGAEKRETAAKNVNTFGPGFIAEASKNIGATFVQISTDYVFSGKSKSPWNELDKMEPRSAYGRTKAEGETQTLNYYQQGSYIFRTAWLYSEFGKNFAKTFVEAAFSSDQELNVVCDQFGQPTFAKDLANQIINAVEKNIPFGIYHATNSGESSWFEFAQEIFELLGANKSRLNAVSSDFYDLPAIRPRYSVLGHNAWKDTVVKPMRNWKIALEEAIPTLIGAKSPVQPKKLRRIKY